MIKRIKKTSKKGIYFSAAYNGKKLEGNSLLEQEENS
jgi:hypothetical protein